MRPMQTFKLYLFGKKGEPRYERMAAFLDALDKRLAPFGRRRIAHAVSELSALLTRKRGSTTAQSYLADPLAQAAYCAHFLPWMLYRVEMACATGGGALFPPESRTEGRKNPVIVEDWGAGPMTGLFALWLWSDELPSALTYRARERERGLLDWGRKLADDLDLGSKVAIEADPRPLRFEKAVPTQSRDVDVLLLFNILNEWLPRRGRDRRALTPTAEAVIARLASAGRLLVIEPAARMSSWGVMALRDLLLRKKMRILAPCTHERACPLLDPRLRSWCHFRRDVAIHPRHGEMLKWLGGGRESLSYSYLLASRAAGRRADERAARPLARVLSDPMPMGNGTGSYACAREGRIALTYSANDASRRPVMGEALPYTLDPRRKRDPKSAALLAQATL